MDNVVTGSTSQSDPMVQFDNALEQARIAVNDICSETKDQIGLWGFFSIVLVVIGSYIGYEFYSDIKKTDYIEGNTINIVFGSIIRITIVTAVFSILNYTLRNLRSYLHIYQRNQHRRYLVYSMSSLIKAGYDFLDRRWIFEQVFAILIKADQTGLLISKEGGKGKKEENSIMELLKIQTELIKTLKDSHGS